MDLVDKSILLELSNNCRTSYQALAKKLGLTVNAIKKRIDKLIEQKVIQRFVIYLSLAMIDAEMGLAILTTEDPVSEEEFLDIIGSHPMVNAVSYLSDGSILLLAEFVGEEGQNTLEPFLRQLPGVNDVEMHTLLVEKGAKTTFSKLDLRVLRCLSQNARMTIAEISECSRIKPKRVRKILRQFLSGGGSLPEYSIGKKAVGDLRTAEACVHFRLWWDLNASGSHSLIVRIGWDAKRTELWDIVDWIETTFPNEFWYAYASASAPVIFAVFIIDHIRDAEPILHKTRQAPHVRSVNPMFGYPARRYMGLRDLRLNELLSQEEQ